MTMKKISFTTIIALLILFTASAYATPVAEKVAVLITSWGAPAGYSFYYSWNSHESARIGDKTLYEGQPCKIGHVGEFPYQLHLGLVPWALHTETAQFEGTFDNSGIYKLVDGMYYSIYPGYPPLTPEMVPAGAPIIPAVEILDPMTGELSFPPDPRTGEDHLAGWYSIGVGTSSNPYPNGLGDFFEKGPLAFLWRFGLMGGPTDPPEAFLEASYALDIFDQTKQMLEASFGDKIDVRFGMYNDIPGYTKHEMDVAEEFAKEGYRKMLLARETTDNNHYANKFMTGNYIKERLCEMGVLDETEIYQTRQVGRSPEFNAMNVINLKNFIEAYPEGSTIGIIYVTRGLPWGGTPPSSWAMGRQHPWHLEVYHENAFINYLSWKKALQKAYGDRYDLVFTAGGVESDLLEDSFYTYSNYVGDKLGGHFHGVRDTIQLAKLDGLDKLLVVPCHWFYDSQDNLIIMRQLNNLPLVPREDTDAGIFDLTYCEDAAENEVDCSSQGAVAEITLAPSYSHVTTEFAISYYVKLRGTLERFGVFPDEISINLEASQMVTKLGGGTVQISNPSSAIMGAAIYIPADPYPDRPEGFTFESAIPINDPSDTNDCLWEDTVINIGHQLNPPSMQGIEPLGPAVHFGPYRNVFNRNVTIAIPFDGAAAAGREVKAFVYNHATDSWDDLEVESTQNGLVIFKTKFLGLFRAGTTETAIQLLSDPKLSLSGTIISQDQNNPTPVTLGMGDTVTWKNEKDLDQVFISFRVTVGCGVWGSEIELLAPDNRFGYWSWYPLDNLDPDVTYEFRIRLQDGAGGPESIYDGYFIRPTLP